MDELVSPLHHYFGDAEINQTLVGRWSPNLQISPSVLWYFLLFVEKEKRKEDKKKTKKDKDKKMPTKTTKYVYDNFVW